VLKHFHPRRREHFHELCVRIALLLGYSARISAHKQKQCSRNSTRKKPSHRLWLLLLFQHWPLFRWRLSMLLLWWLTSLTLNGTEYPLTTRDVARSKKGKGRRSAGLIGGGAGLGMLVGGVASGGTGLLVVGLVGGGAGTAVAGLTGNGDIEIPAESIVRFRLADDLVVQPAQDVNVKRPKLS
jgi:hypothetical protein